MPQFYNFYVLFGVFITLWCWVTGCYDQTNCFRQTLKKILWFLTICSYRLFFFSSGCLNVGNSGANLTILRPPARQSCLQATPKDDNNYRTRRRANRLGDPSCCRHVRINGNAFSSLVIIRRKRQKSLQGVVCHPQIKPSSWNDYTSYRLFLSFDG